ncbi:HNH endonuclease [Roseomonas chloroacetimidivorans]|uniref:HNH endonuclease n=1 Tax=Roseomonas chloroacetimidivorans TaxID=1766656 RepID=UPI003C738713
MTGNAEEIARVSLPRTVDEFKRKSNGFPEWLVANGSAILKPTNDYEVMRFNAREAVAVIYRNAGRAITSWSGGADDAWAAWKSGKSWRACERGQRPRGKRHNLILTLAQRDGWGCLYCARPLSLTEATIEHVVSITHGGPTHPANLALACAPCNAQASHLSAAEKVRLAIRRTTP